MKMSKYNMVVPYQEKYIYYNMITKAIILSKDPVVNMDSKVFVDNGFWLKNEVDELRSSEMMLHKEQFDKSHLVLTIIPTFQCNLDCSYCYEHELHEINEVLDMGILEGILHEIKKDDDLKSVHIEWNGGEPLLEISLIEKYSEAMIALCNKKGIAYSASISTNLFEINEEILNILIKSKITSISTTLAGTADIHDRYRFTRYRHEGSFYKVWENIKKTIEYIPVTICINITADSEPDAYKLMDKLAMLNTDKFSVSFLLVENYGYGEEKLFLKKETHFPVMLRMLEYAIKCKLNAELNSNFGDKRVFCAAHLKKGFLIHPSGRMYKCANEYSLENSIGTVSEKGFIFSKNCAPMNPYKNDYCKKCSILPYCNGGCLYAKSQGKSYCPPEKDYLKELLRLYVSNTYKIT